MEKDVTEAVGASNLNKAFKTLVSRKASEGFSKAKDCLARAKAKLDHLEGSVSLGDVEEDVCLLYDEEVGVQAKVHRTLKDNVAFWHESGAS